jgi:hypothetical protein
MPTSVTLERIPELDVRDDILRCYSYQIQLRLVINSIRYTLYRSSKDRQTTLSSSATTALDENLKGWRKMLNDWDWDDNDYECSNINIARMRDKYYRAKHILWRPVLYNALLQGEGLVLVNQAPESPLRDKEALEFTLSAISNPCSASSHRGSPDIASKTVPCLSLASEWIKDLC